MMNSATLQSNSSKWPLAALTLIRIEQARRKAQRKPWDEWLHELFPLYVTAPFSDRHRELWEWIEELEPGTKPRPFIALWPRGGAKSTTAELGVVRVGANQSRFYVWYVSGTQDQADQHVSNISSLLESESLAALHPALSERKLGKYGHSRGWRRSRLRTASGLTIDAIGLDKAARGTKVEERRPDLIILDDVDELHDSRATTSKKIQTITKSILPAGSPDCAVLFIQNLIHPESIASMLADGRADFLADRHVSGPFPAVEGLEYEQVDGRFFIAGGSATWEGQDIEACQGQIDEWGLSAFLQEAQHDVDRTGGIWDHIDFMRIAFDDVPDLMRGCVWVDPAISSTDQSDSMGIQADGIDEDGVIYRFYSWEQITSPEDALKRAINKALELGFGVVGVETDQGGDTWRSVYERARQDLEKERSDLNHLTKWPKYADAKAGAGHGGKIERNAKMLVDYEHGRVVHVRGTHKALERSLRRFPNKPLDLADAAYWSWNMLRKGSISLPDQPEQPSRWQTEERSAGWAKRY